MSGGTTGFKISRKVLTGDKSGRYYYLMGYHGTTTGYINHGCRCRACSKAVYLDRKRKYRQVSIDESLAKRVDLQIQAQKELANDPYGTRPTFRSYVNKAVEAKLYEDEVDPETESFFIKQEIQEDPHFWEELGEGMSS